MITEEWSALKGQRRQQEWLAGRLMLQELAEKGKVPFTGVEKNGLNKPFLAERKANISLSHTKSTAAACLHTSRRVGVDIEYASPRVARIAHKFLNEEERKATSEDWERMLMYWCAKEALYKLQDHSGIIFKEELLIEPANQEGLLRGMVRSKDESIDATLWVEKEAGRTIVCALEQ